MSYFPQILTLAVIIALFATWLGLIVRQNRLAGPARPLHERQWYLNIYRRGWRNLFRCKWALWLPLLGIFVAVAESKAVNFLILKQHPEYRQLQEQFNSQMGEGGISSFLKALSIALSENFLKSANELTKAVFSSLFSSYFLMALFLFAAMAILLKPRGDAEEDLHFRRRNLLAVASGVAGILLFLSFACWHFSTFQRPNSFFWMFLPTAIFFGFVPAFAFGACIRAVDAADRGEQKSFQAAISEGSLHFRALFLFFLLTSGLGILSTLLPLNLLWMLQGDVLWLSAFMRLIDAIKFLFLITVSLIPLLIVVRRLSLRSAFDECISLWAREWKNLLVFFTAGALVLLIPVTLENRVSTVGTSAFFGIGGAAGWVVQVIKIVLGAFLLSSFVVFLKELRK
jgi:hypothetical protein